VLCLDEFEVWLRHQKEFDDAFFDHLRSLMNNNTLMLIISSLRPLDEYSQQHKLTSPFFNVGRQLRLELFSDEEVNELLSLPASTTPATQAALSADEQHTVRRWGGRHPYLLQLAASLLWQAQQQGKAQRWAKVQFEREKKRGLHTVWWRRPWTKPLSWLLWKFPQHLGSWIQWLGGSVDDLKKWALGIITLLVLVVVISSVLLHETVPAQLLHKLWERLTTLLGI